MKIDSVRDRWGVPRITAPSELDAIYAQGYVQAQDRLPTLLKAYRKAVGSMAEFFGPDWIEHDIKQKQFRHEAVARAAYPHLSPFYQNAIDAFIAGIQHFIRENPSQLPAWSLTIEPYHILALSRAAKWDYIVLQAYHDLGAITGEHPESGIGSNMWAIAPHLSAENAVMLLSDPHVPYTDEWLMHECHLHGGDLHVYGFQLPGLPYIQFGHNQHVAWGITSGGADVCDVYELTLNDQNQYRYDGAWHDLSVDILTVSVNIDSQINIISREQLSSHHGPLMHHDGDYAYAFKIAYADLIYDHVEALGELNKSQNVAAAQEVFAQHSFGPFNFIVSDTAGNIFYQSAGHVPIRPDGVDCLQPLSGDTSATEWQGFHESSALPSLLNPPNGWLQHCNNAPWHITDQNLLNVNDYPLYMLTGQHPPFEDGNTARGRYLTRRLQSVSQMTLPDALSLATDCTMDGAKLWLDALFSAFQTHQSTFRQLADAIQILRSWDLQAHRDSLAMPLFWEWFLALPDEDELLSIWNNLLREPKLAEDDQLALLSALKDARDYLLEQWGTLEIPWKHVYQMQRGNAAWGIDGCIGLTLRVIGGAWEPDENGIYTPNFGQSCPMLVLLKPGAVQSWSALPFGINENPASPHFTDQGQKVFAAGKLKDTHFMAELPADEIESRQTITRNLPAR